MIAPDLGCPVISTKDEIDFRSVIRHVVAGGRGADLVVILGTTGEFHALGIEDKKRLVDVAVDEVAKQKREIAGRAPLELSVGITGESLQETIELAQYTEEKSGNVPTFAFLMPIYVLGKQKGRFTRRGVTGVVQDVLDNTEDIRLILYNHPGMTGGKNIRTASWKELSGHSRIVAMKDSSGDVRRAEDYARATHGRAKFYIGDEILGLHTPYNGVVAGSANVFPVAWNLAVKRDIREDDMTAMLAQRLKSLQRIYAKNTVGAFRELLYRKDVISFRSREALSPRNKVNPSFSEELRWLAGNKDFKEVYALNKE